MTFRMDDLLVAVMPDGFADAQSTACGPNTQCTPCTKCTCRTAPPTPCDDPATDKCLVCTVTCEGNSDCDNSALPCNATQTGSPAKKKNWRDEQFALVSQELEAALAR